MRTSVHTDPTDVDETDEFPEMAGSVEESGALTIHTLDGDVETTYQPGEWISVETVA